MNGSEHLRAATYNVHGCIGTDGLRSEQRIAEIIAALEVDIIGLQELDLNRARSAHLDQAEWIGEQLRWHKSFHPAMQAVEEQYGDAILSRWPIKVRLAGALPAAPPFYCRETRGALWVEIETPAGPLHVVNTHLGLGRRERIAQAGALAGPDWLGRVPAGDPLMLLGDLNSLPGSAAHRLLARPPLRDARTCVPRPPRLATYPTRMPLLAVDHIFVNGHLSVERIAVIRNPETRVASDHYPVVAELRLSRKI